MTYIDGDYMENKTHFSEVLWGTATTHYVVCAEEMSDRCWAEVFRCLNAVRARRKQVEYANYGGPSHPIPTNQSPIRMATPSSWGFSRRMRSMAAKVFPHPSCTIPSADINFRMTTRLASVTSTHVEFNFTHYDPSNS